MHTTEFDLLAIARQHLADIEAGVATEQFAGYFNEHVIQIEYPNALNPGGGQSDLAVLKERHEKGRHIVTRQSFDIQKEYVAGQTVILELVWTGYFSIPIGHTKPGEPVTARFALFMEFENGKIIKQRNYDCFNPF